MVENTEFWMVLTAIVFTAVGYFMGWNSSTKYTVEKTVEQLMDRGYLKVRTRPDGTKEILKHDEN